MTRVLIIEDNMTIAHGVRAALESEGIDVRLAVDGIEGLERVRMWEPDIVILDLMLPKRDGLDVLQDMRAAHLGMPVLILSARGDDIDKVRGFRTGADDYVTKPFSLDELIARIEALARRYASAAVDQQRRAADESFGPLRMSTSTREVWHRGRAVELRPREFDLLLALVRRQGGAASRRDLMREVWGYEDDVESRTIDTHMVELRRRLERGGRYGVRVVTTRRIGYRLVIDDAAVEA